MPNEVARISKEVLSISKIPELKFDFSHMHSHYIVVRTLVRSYSKILIIILLYKLIVQYPISIVQWTS